MKILTIAIPTYNGELTISESMSTILKSFNCCNIDEVELIISDNASIDNTKTIVNSLIANNKTYDIKYYNNNINVGFDCNVDLCVKRANGKYVWLFSDSEIIIDDNAVNNILEVLKQREYDFLMLNYDNGTHFECMSEYYVSGDDFFQRTSFRSNFITSCIVNKNKWMDLQLEKYYNSYWIQSAYQIKALSPNTNCCAGYIDDIYIGSTKSKAKWGHNGSFIMVGIKLLKLYTEMNQLGYSKETISKACDVIKGGYPLNICLARIKGLKMSKLEIDELLTICRQLYNPLGIINIFFFQCPVVFCYIYYIGYRTVRLVSKVFCKIMY